MDILESNSWRMECKVDAETKKDYLVQKRAGGYGEQKWQWCAGTLAL